MTNYKVRGFPKEGPYTKVEIDIGSFTLTFIKMVDGSVVCPSYIKHDASILTIEAEPPKSIKNAAYRQACAVFKKSEERVSKPT